MAKPDGGMSVIIPACNQDAVLGACLDLLLAQDHDGSAHILVVANGCAEGTSEVARSYEHAMRNRGFDFELIELAGASKARAINVGDALALYRDRVYVDADVQLSRDALSAIADAFRAGASVKFCAPRLAPAVLSRTPRDAAPSFRAPGAPLCLAPRLPCPAMRTRAMRELAHVPIVGGPYPVVKSFG